MKQWRKEPLLHFLVIGAMIFVFFSIANKEEAAVSGNKIIVSSAEIERLGYNWSKRWNRPPTETELQGLIESYIKEEVYYREALTLGLDQNDTILRRRLMQKMEFLSNDLAELNQPDETELNWTSAGQKLLSMQRMYCLNLSRRERLNAETALCWSMILFRKHHLKLSVYSGKVLRSSFSDWEQILGTGR
jgi:hypothetical protein